MIRTALPIALGIAIVLVAAGTYWALESLLVSYADHDRGLWEGAAVVVVMSAGSALANRVFGIVDAPKKEACLSGSHPGGPK